MWWNQWGLVVNALNSDIVVKEFELLSGNYLQTNNIRKIINFSYVPK